MDRRARTRKLIELGGLVQKSGLVTVANDDRALILGALIIIVRILEGQSANEKRAEWRALGDAALKASGNRQITPQQQTAPYQYLIWK